MRAFLGWLLLLALCGLAWFLQSRWTKGIRAEREAELSSPTDFQGREESWSRVTIGRPSGAEPIDLTNILPENWERVIEGSAGGEEPLPVDEGEQANTYRAPDFVYTVPEGRVLSKICVDFYNSGRPPIPQRVAEYNGLANPDGLRAGFQLRLPPWEVLFPDGRERP